MAMLRARGPAAFPNVLAALIEDPSASARPRLIALLAEYSESMETTEPYVADLLRLIAKGGPDIPAELRPVFLKAGPSFLPSLERLFASPEAPVRAAAARALGAFGPSDLLRKNLAATSPLRVEAALIALSVGGRYKVEEFAPDARSFLVHKDPRVRAAAALAYGAIAPDKGDAVRALLQLLGDRQESVREAAAAALAPLAVSHLPDLVAALETADGEPRRLLGRIVSNLSAEAAPAYGRLLLAAPPAVRDALLQAYPRSVIAGLDPEARDRIVAWARGTDVPIRLLSMRLMGHDWPDRGQALHVLEEAARAAEPAVRAAAIPLLARCDKAGVALIRAALSDSDPLVRMEAACELLRANEPGPDPLPLCVSLIDRTPVASQRIGEMGARGLGAIDNLVRVARSTESPECSAAARRALERVLDSPPADAVLGRAAAVAAAPAELRARWEKALAWLAAAQEPDGSWDGERWDGASRCDTGLTGLALLAFLSAGETDSSGTHAEVVRKTLRYLCDQQDDDGSIGPRISHSFIIQHGIAATAVAEAACVCRNGRALDCTKRAMRFISESRNPGHAWRYEPRGGENDTFVTAWMVMALKAGEMSGVPADPEAYAGALRWVDRMTGPLGRTGYNSPSGSPASPEGVWKTQWGESINLITGSTGDRYGSARSSAARYEPRSSARACMAWGSASLSGTAGCPSPASTSATVTGEPWLRHRCRPLRRKPLLPSAGPLSGIGARPSSGSLPTRRTTAAGRPSGSGAAPAAACSPRRWRRSRSSRRTPIRQGASARTTGGNSIRKRTRCSAADRAGSAGWLGGAPASPAAFRELRMGEARPACPASYWAATISGALLEAHC
jgi:HEAT repeat protein